MSIKGLRLGAVALIAGGALTGGLLFGGALVSAQTPDETPAAEEDATETPADSTTPSVTPESDETPTDSTDDADKGDTDATPEDEESEHDGNCNKDGDGQPGARSESGTRFSGERTAPQF